MGTVRKNFRLPAEVNNALNAASVPPYTQTYLLVEALKAYKPIKKHLESVADIPATTEKSVIGIPATVKEPSIAEQIFDYWRQVMGKGTNAKLTAKRLKNIKARLSEGYTAEQIGHAIQGCKLSAWHMGDNDRNKPFNDIELICRDGQKLEDFIEVLNRGHQNVASGQVQGNAQGNNRPGGNSGQQTPLQRTIADYDEGMAYARTLRENLEAPVADVQEVRSTLE